MIKNPVVLPLIYRDFPVVSLLLQEIKANDPETYYHSLRVADISNEIVKELDISQSEKEEIVISALMHDLGKLLIPDVILKSKNSLSDIEWEIMKQHPVLGARYARLKIPNDKIIKNILCHHERLNGTGYPEGLSADEIPLGAKVIAVSDSIDAMLSHRRYDNHKSFEFAKNEISKNKDILYDSHIADIALSKWDKIKNMYL